MAQSKQAIKGRIDSVDSTRKITNAMQLVASAKLNRARQLMDRNRDYAGSLMELLAVVLKGSDTKDTLVQGNPDLPSFVFMISSDMGLCGGYNANVYRQALQDLKPNDYLFVIGSRGTSWAKARDLHIEGSITDLSEDNAYADLSSAMDKALHLYKEGVVGAIKVLYTHYKNTLTFEPTMDCLLPPSAQKQENETNEISTSTTIFEPGYEAMLEEILPMAAKSQLYSHFLESKTSEQASRRLAMETATDNANELMDELNLVYNRVRQSAITQEITEIVSGANALA